MTAPVPTSTARLRPFLLLFGLGLLGVAALPMMLVPTLREAVARGMELPLPLEAMAVVSLIQPALLVALAAWVGVVLAPKVGLRSHVAAHATRTGPLQPPLVRELPLAVIIGLAVGVVLVLLDLAMRPALGEAAERISFLRGRTLGMTLAGMLYGGITEEIMLRWGLMTLVAWAGWRMTTGGAATPPGEGVMTAAVLIAALLFAVGHLPAVSASAPLTGPVVARVTVLNLVAGTAYGWLYWRRSLEAAMAAHAATHVAFTAASWLA